MLDHVSIPVRDLDAAVRFYDAILAVLGHDRVYLTPTAAGYGERNSPGDDSHTYLTVVQDPGAEPRDCHWAFRAPARADVYDFFAAATANGGTATGAPGLWHEYHPGYYAAFVTDPASNRLEAVTHRSR